MKLRGNAVTALGSQPLLRFCGVRGFGDELYDLVGLEYLLGMRPGPEGEVLVYMERGTAACNVFKKITGQDPGQLTPVRGAAGAGGLCVALEQTLSCSAGGQTLKGPRPQPMPTSTRAAGSTGSAWGAWGANSKGTSSASAAASVAKAPAKTSAPEPIADSWED